MPVLEYSPEKRFFWYKTDVISAVPSHMQISMAGGSRSLGFPDWFPRNLLALTMYKDSYGTNAKATPTAVSRIKEIIKEKGTAFVSSYQNLLTGNVYGHQLEAIEAMQHNDRLAMLLEQGLGKTYISLMALKLLKARGLPSRAIVICPKIVFMSWKNEIRKFAPELRTVEYIGDFKQRLAARELVLQNNWDIILTTYDMFVLHSSSDKAYEALMWKTMSSEKRADWVKRFSEVSEDEKALLLKNCSSDSWLRKCAGIISRQPFYAKPSIREIKQADNILQLLGDAKVDVLIADEASRLINHSSKRSKAIEALGSQVSRAYLLSGTLCVGRPIDMYQPMNVLDPVIINRNWTKFKDEYCRVSPYNRNIIVGYKNVDTLKLKIEPYIMAKKRVECLDLPERIVTEVYYDITEDAKELYNQIADIKTTTVKLSDGSFVRCDLPVVKIQKCLQVLSGFINTGGPIVSAQCEKCDVKLVEQCVLKHIYPGEDRCQNKEEISIPVTTHELGENAKLDVLQEDLEDLVDNQKVIIWAWYQFDIRAIEGLLKKLKIKYVLASQKNCAAEFEQDSSVRVFLGQTMQGIGITLNSATTMIYYSHGTALEPRLQSMDRNLRIGQTKSVLVKDYICKGSLEEKIVELLRHKEDVKDFMQKSVRCVQCDNMSECLDNKVHLYGPGCMYYENKLAAEEIVTLSIPQLRMEGELCQQGIERSI